MKEDKPPPGSPQQRAGMRAAIWTQCFGIFAEGMVVNGTLLLYLTALGVSASRTMVILAIYPMTGAALLLPFAWLSDRIGKKRVGSTGVVIGTLGWALVGLAGFAGEYATTLITIGIFLAALCFSMVGSSWFSILSAIVPEEIRGRYFARLRTAFSVVSIALSLIYAAILAQNSEVIVYQVIFLVAAGAYVARCFSYRRIPELELPQAKDRAPFFRSILTALANGPLRRFCIYAFLLTMFTAGTGSLVALLEKHAAGFSDGQIVLLANLSMAGAVTGMFFGGKIIDHRGPRTVFAVCHLALGIGLSAFLLRVLFPAGNAQFLWLACLHFVLGSARGAIGIAMTSELMTLLPSRTKSVSAATFSIFQTCGVALSGFIPAWLIDTGWLAENWDVAGRPLSHFDSILLGCSMITILLTAALRLIPSMSREAQATSLGLNRL